MELSEAFQVAERIIHIFLSESDIRKYQEIHLKSLNQTRIVEEFGILYPELQLFMDRQILQKYPGESLNFRKVLFLMRKFLIGLGFQIQRKKDVILIFPSLEISSYV